MKASQRQFESQITSLKHEITDKERNIIDMHSLNQQKNTEIRFVKGQKQELRHELDQARDQHKDEVSRMNALHQQK